MTKSRGRALEVARTCSSGCSTATPHGAMASGANESTHGTTVFPWQPWHVPDVDRRSLARRPTYFWQDSGLRTRLRLVLARTTPFESTTSAYPSGPRTAWRSMPASWVIT